MKYRLGDITVKHWNDWDRVPRMPQVVGNFILGSALGSTALFGSITLGYAVGYIAITAVTSWALRALAPKPSFGGAGSRGLLVNAREATAPQQIVYGEIRKGGTITFIESTGDTNQYLHQIIVLAGHEVNSIGDIYINDEVVTLDGSGFVTDAKWQDGDSNSKIRIKKHTGADNQTADTDLVSETSVTSDFKGQGIAYIYVRMEYDQDVFAEGVPLFTAKVQGKKVYDPRSSSTGYSANAALCIRDYLVSAYGLDNSGDVNEAYFQTAANTCDDDVTLAGSGTENRYEINGVISLDQSPSDILGDMMTACAGTLFWGQGEWHLKVGEYTSPIKTFTLDDLRGPITLDTKHSRRDNFNIVRGTFNDANQGYIRADYPEIRSSTFIANDGGVEDVLDLALPFTTSSAMAQRLAKMTLFRAREQMTFTADFSLEAFEVECGDIIALTIDRYGEDWSEKEFEVVGWKFKNDGDAGDLRVALTLRETSSAAFSWTAEESDITGNDSTVTNPAASLDISSLSTSGGGRTTSDGTFIDSVIVSWTAPNNKFITHYEVQWKPSADSNYASTTTRETSIELSPLVDGVEYIIRVRAVTSNGRSGSFASALFTGGGDTTAPSIPYNMRCYGHFGYVKLRWTKPLDADFSHVEIYANTTDSTSTATLVGIATDDNFIHDDLDINTEYFYWLKSVDYSGNKSNFNSSGTYLPFISADEIVAGVTYDIYSVGTTDFTLIGASSNSILVEFVATGPGTGTGLVKSRSARTTFIDDTSFEDGIRQLFIDSNLDVVEPVSSLPAAGEFVNQQVFLTSDQKLYFWDVTQWKAVVPNIEDGTITGDKLVANTITSGALSTGLLLTDSAQIDNSLITNAKIKNAAVDTLKVAGESITIASFTDFTSVTGTGPHSFSQNVDMDYDGNIIAIATITTFGSAGSSATTSYKLSIDGTTMEAVAITGGSVLLGLQTLSGGKSVNSGTITVEAEAYNITGYTPTAIDCKMTILRRYR